MSNDPKDKTANKDSQVERTLSKDNVKKSSAATSSEHEITKNKTIIKNTSPKLKDNTPNQKQANPIKQPDTYNSGSHQNPMPGLDGPTRLQNINDYSDLKRNSPFNEALAKGKNFSAEFAQGFASIPKKIITAYQGYIGEENKSSVFKQLGLVILACILFYFWTVLRLPQIQGNSASSESHALMVDIIELYSKGEKRKAKILLKKAAEIEQDEVLAQKLKQIIE